MFLMLDVIEVVLFGVLDVEAIIQEMSVCGLAIRVGVFGVGQWKDTRLCY